MSFCPCKLRGALTLAHRETSCTSGGAAKIHKAEPCHNFAVAIFRTKCTGPPTEPAQPGLLLTSVGSLDPFTLNGLISSRSAADASLPAQCTSKSNFGEGASKPDLGDSAETRGASAAPRSQEAPSSPSLGSLLLSDLVEQILRFATGCRFVKVPTRRRTATQRMPPNPLLQTLPRSTASVCRPDLEWLRLSDFSYD